MHYCRDAATVCSIVHINLWLKSEELGLEDKTIGIAPVGCAVFAYRYIDIDWIEAAHGRARPWPQPSSALSPDKMVFTTRATAIRRHRAIRETIYAPPTVAKHRDYIINNGIYGMTRRIDGADNLKGW